MNLIIFENTRKKQELFNFSKRRVNLTFNFINILPTVDSLKRYKSSLNHGTIRWNDLKVSLPIYKKKTLVGSYGNYGTIMIIQDDKYARCSSTCSTIRIINLNNKCLSLIHSEKNVFNFSSDSPCILETRFTKIYPRSYSYTPQIKLIINYKLLNFTLPAKSCKKIPSTSPADVTLIDAVSARVTARNRE